MMSEQDKAAAAKIAKTVAKSFAMKAKPPRQWEDHVGDAYAAISTKWHRMDTSKCSKDTWMRRVAYYGIIDAIRLREGRTVSKNPCHKHRERALEDLRVSLSDNEKGSWDHYRACVKHSVALHCRTMELLEAKLELDELRPLFPKSMRRLDGAMQDGAESVYFAGPQVGRSKSWGRVTINHFVRDNQDVLESRYGR